MLPEISIHALREEGDRNTGDRGRRGGYFYPRPPRGGRPGSAVLLHEPPDISIHALREEGDVNLRAVLQVIAISIHALREEGDLRS